MRQFIFVALVCSSAVVLGMQGNRGIDWASGEPSASAMMNVIKSPHEKSSSKASNISSDVDYITKLRGLLESNKDNSSAPNLSNVMFDYAVGGEGITCKIIYKGSEYYPKGEDGNVVYYKSRQEAKNAVCEYFYNELNGSQA